MSNITLGNFIQSQINQRGMSIREFAELAGISHTSMNTYIRHGTDAGVGTPSGEFMYKLAKVTSTDIGYLWRLVYPDLPPPPAVSEETALHLARVINALPDAERELILNFIFRRRG